MLSLPELTLSEIRLSTTRVVLPDGAADAAVHHLDDLRLSRLLAGVLPKQRVVDTNLG